MSELFEAINARRSHARVTAEAPTTAELLRLVAAAGRVADHGALKPWRLIELRGDARRELGAALAAASGRAGKDAERIAAKPLRAELLIALVACRRESAKVPDWEQDVAAAGVAHMLGLLLADAGWGVMWRTGPFTRSPEVRAVHRLAQNEVLLGWLYVGGVPEGAKTSGRAPLDPARHLSSL